jgi:hypothetical protein
MSSQRDGKRQVPARFIHSVGGQQRAAKPQTKTSKGTKFCRLKASSWKEHNEAPADPARFDPLIRQHHIWVGRAPAMTQIQAVTSEQSASE